MSRNLHLKSVVLPDSLKKLGLATFAENPSLKRIDIPAEVTFIDNFVFNMCTGLKKVQFVSPNTLTTLGRSAFQHCGSFKRIKLPDTLKVIEKSTFGGCTKLSKIILPDDLKHIGHTAFGKSALTTVTFPISATRLTNGRLHIRRRL